MDSEPIIMLVGQEYMGQYTKIDAIYILYLQQTSLPVLLFISY